MVRAEIDINKSIEENASLYFDKAKKLSRKLEGAKAALEKAKKKQEKILRDLPEVESPLRAKRVAEQKKEWFERFRWFISSDGFLVIGGRDAATNEIAIKKHAEPEDLILHTDMAGSPFFVIKSDGKEISEQTISEAADAAVTFSRAWKFGLAHTEVFAAKPEQVSKKANPGEHLQRGAFMVRGRIRYVDNRINLSLGIYKGKVMAGPLEAVRANCKDYVLVSQGREKASQAAKKIQKVIGGEIDEIIRSLPAGGFHVQKASEAKSRHPKEL